MRLITFANRIHKGRLIVPVLALLAAGCGDDSGPPRFPVSGQITLDGKPLASGTITFLPLFRGNGTSSEIVDGNYGVSGSEGLHPGEYKVEIISIRPSGRQVSSPDFPGTTVEETENILPRRYGVDSKLQVAVKHDAENTFEFKLTSQPDPASGRRPAARKGRIARGVVQR